MANATTTRQGILSCPACGTLNRIDLARLDDGPRCSACRQPFELDRPQTVSGDTLDQVVAGTAVPVLIDFYADWCPPCRIMAPVLDQFARDRAGQVLVGKLDTDRSSDVVMRFRIRGIPTLIMFAGGREVARRVGVLRASELDELLDSVAQLPT
jgi:thioredoxin 2